MTTFNIWLGVSDTAKAEFKLINESFEEGGAPYVGPMDDKTFRILGHMHDANVVVEMFKHPTLGPHVRSLFSLYPHTNVSGSLDYLEEQWPGHFIVAGAWQWDGRQIGTQWELDVDGNPTGAVTGTPTYPIVEAALLQFMPDTPNDDGVIDTDLFEETGQIEWLVPPTWGPATELTDVNLLMGQTPRRFS
jgi:hypothetical protein